jgi:hypothetical protein
MDKHRYQPSEEHFEQINESVKKYALEKDLGTLEKERDEGLVQFLALKREASSLNSGMASSRSVCNENKELVRKFSRQRPKDSALTKEKFQTHQWHLSKH